MLERSDTMKVIVVSSGKGGVGKTTISMKIAYELKERGHNVGLMDVDIDTPNLAEFIGQRPEFGVDSTVNPVIVDGIEMASIGFMIDDSMCVTWDGERRSSVIDDLFNGIAWTCDVLVVDTPPGTTEEMKHIISNYTPDGVVVVTTLHPASITDVKRTLTLMKMLNANVLGVVNNMSYLECPCCNAPINIFGTDFPLEIMGVGMIASIPFDNGCEDQTRVMKTEMSVLCDTVEGVL